MRAAAALNLPTGGRQGELLALADVMGRSHAAVKLRASRLRVKSHRPWTPTEDAAVLDRSRMAKQIAPDIGRTVRSVEHRRSLLRRGLRA